MNTNTHTRAYKRLIRRYNVIRLCIIYKTRAWNSVDFRRLISIVTQHHRDSTIVLKFVLRGNKKFTRVKNTYHPCNSRVPTIVYDIVRVHKIIILPIRYAIRTSSYSILQHIMIYISIGMILYSTAVA